MQMESSQQTTSTFESPLQLASTESGDRDPHTIIRIAKAFLPGVDLEIRDGEVVGHASYDYFPYFKNGQWLRPCSLEGFLVCDALGTDPRCTDAAVEFSVDGASVGPAGCRLQCTCRRAHVSFAGPDREDRLDAERREGCGFEFDPPRPRA